MSIWQRLLISLLLTELLELPAAGLLGVKKQALPAVFLVNILTNPAAVTLLWILGLYVPALPSLLAQIPVECLVVLAEGMVYRGFSREEIPRPFLLAVAANGFSWGMGLLLSGR